MRKYFNKILIIDGSYMIQRGLHVKSLWELKNKNGDRTGGIYQFLKSLYYVSINNNYYPVVTWDSGLSDRRVKVYPMYKKHHLRVADKLVEKYESLDEIYDKLDNYDYLGESALDEIKNSINESMKNRSTFDKSQDEDDLRVQYHRQRDILITILGHLGIPSIKIKGWEGDDLMTLVSRISNNSIIVTDDKDLIQLISPSIDINRPMTGNYLKYDEYMKDNNLVSSRQVAIIKAIVGDPSDNIPSVTSGLERKYCVGYGRAKDISRLIIENNEDDSKYLNILNNSDKNYNKGFASRINDYKRNMKLVDLSLVEDDNEVINSIIYEISRSIGSSNLIKLSKSLSEQGISNFDSNTYLSHKLLLDTMVNIKE